MLSRLDRSAIWMSLVLVALARAAVAHGGEDSAKDSRGEDAPSLRSLLDAPLLFVKQHPYFAAHIYDDYITWHPGGGIYVLENPADLPERRRVRPVIDPTTKETLGEGVYRDPELSWDAKRVLFAFKGEADGGTSIYEIAIDGTALRRLTNPDADCACDKPEKQPKADQPTRIGGGHHDVMPCYLPDGRIVFSSTRPKALVPCFNSSVNTLHVMQADGSNIRPLSVNNVNEFDPSVLPDGRILYGRWEYVDKTALYMQSLWTILPDGRMEEAYFANNLAKPTALLDGRPVPGTHLVVASLTPHNGQAVGAIGMIDMHLGKNNLQAITNFTPEYPTEMDQGLTRGPCDPWPLSNDAVLISNNAKGNAEIQIVYRSGRRDLVHAEPDISCYAPMLVKPRPKPPIVAPHSPGLPGARASCPPNAAETSALPSTGNFLVVDVCEGLTGVARGTVKRLRIVEETARISDIPPGGRWWNQAFPVSWQGAYIVKNILGTVPVHADGSAYFEAPAGRAIYFEALDEEGREIQRMRTFVQAAPGVTRSCVGCHENKMSAPPRLAALPQAGLHPPTRPQPESWGSGFVDYPTMVQPILDKYCVRCHGGAEGMGKGLDYSGGWTWAFSISYETLIKHRMVGFLNCENGSVHTSKILPPRTIGSGAAPLAKVLITRHPEMDRKDRDLFLAWMDTNANYHGTWDYTPDAVCGAVLAARGPLDAAMQEAACTECHAKGHVGNDWINLQTPEWSRLLRAPTAKSAGGLGLEFCRKRKARTGYPLVDQSVQPPDVVMPSRQPPWDPSGEAHVSFTSADDPHYRAMLEIIKRTRREALARPRIDMPGAEPIPGQCRMMVPPPVPDVAPAPSATLRADGAVELRWPQTAATIGLAYAVHRLEKGTQIGLTTTGRFVDPLPPPGRQNYAIQVVAGELRSRPAYASIEVPAPLPPPAPEHVTVKPLSGGVALAWAMAGAAPLRCNVYRVKAGAQEAVKLNREPLPLPHYVDAAVEPETAYTYTVRAVDRRGQEGPSSAPVQATAPREVQEPIFVADFAAEKPAARCGEKSVPGSLHAGAKLTAGVLDLRNGGFALFEHRGEFDLGRAVSAECWVRIDQPSTMPVVLSCGAFQQTGWFLQSFGGGWRWHLGGVSCDGGQKVQGRWVHLVATFNGREAVLYQDGKRVAAVECEPDHAPWSGPLVIGQYSSRQEAYQVVGQIKGVKLYQRALRPEEVQAAHRAGAGQ